MQWQALKFAGSIGDYDIICERNGYNGRYSGLLRKWNDQRGHGDVCWIHGNSEEEFKVNAERKVEELSNL